MTIFDSLFCLANDGWAEACETAVGIMTLDEMEREALQMDGAFDPEFAGADDLGWEA